MRDPARSLASLHPEIAAFWIPGLNDRAPVDVAAQAHLPAWWRCPLCDAPYLALISNRVHGKCVACPPCSRAAGGAKRAQTRHARGRNLAAQYPDIAAELTGDPPAAEVSPGSHAPRVWRCSRCSGLFRASPVSRTRQSLDTASRGCPKCWSRLRAEHNRRRVQELLDEKGSLAETRPDLCEEWDPDNTLRPSDVRPGANVKVGWVGKTCGHRWTAIVARRADPKHPQGCPICAGQKVAATGTSW